MLHRRRMMQANPPSPDLLATLVQANQLMTESRPLEAAPLFASVAEAMHRSNHPRRAANLYARAAHAYADGNNAQAALGNSKSALDLFAQAQMSWRAATFYANITRKLAANGMQGAAKELEREYGSRITNLPTKPIAIPPLRRGLLPTSCPKCGAPVHTADGTWVDDDTLECEYCGAYIRSD